MVLREKNRLLFAKPKILATFAPPKRIRPNFGAGDLVAQQVEHNTFNVGVLGSSPSGITLKATTEARCFGCLFFVAVRLVASTLATTKTNTGKAGLLLFPLVLCYRGYEDNSV